MANFLRGCTPSLSRTTLAVFAVVLGLIIFSVYSPAAYPAGSGGGGGFTAPPPARSLTPEQQSERLFKAGIRHRDKALKQEAKAAAARAADKTKAQNRALAKAQKEFAKAIEKQSEAIQFDPQNYKAANELGYALRKTGDYRKAIGAYNYSLKINPNFHQATEYRAEALLALGYLEETKGAYLKLFRNDRELAGQLMAAMQAWLAAKGKDLSEDEAAFSAWVEERQRLANITTDLSLGNTRVW